ncbi:MAG: hypothetical protein DRP16_02745 [Candidatus Aenigmatarchaeota archaeon]|nr:MAG: hypothetical protein DRP16_02745 [Candidatus Aenigmarchaeota archaeon]
MKVKDWFLEYVYPEPDYYMSVFKNRRKGIFVMIGREPATGKYDAWVTNKDGNVIEWVAQLTTIENAIKKAINWIKEHS